MASQGAREALTEAIKQADRASERAIRVKRQTDSTSRIRARRLEDLKPGVCCEVPSNGSRRVPGPLDAGARLIRSGGAMSDLTALVLVLVLAVPCGAYALWIHRSGRQ